MDRTKAQWLAKADLAASRVCDLEDGYLGKSDLWNPSMSIEEAIEVECRNVTFCLRMADEAPEITT